MVRFAFQPVVNLTTGGVAALETLARPESGDILARARREPELDGRLAALAIRAAARRESLLPLHVNVFAGTLADLGFYSALRNEVRQAGRLPWEITVDIVPPYTHVPQHALLEAVATVRSEGFRICADGIGDGDVPLRLLTDLAPELMKLDVSLLSRPAAVRAMRTLCEQLGALLSVEGVETELQCAAAVSAGAQLAQGDLFAPPARLPSADVYVPALSPAVRGVPRSGPSVGQFVRPAALLLLPPRRPERSEPCSPGRPTCPVCCSWIRPGYRSARCTGHASCCRCPGATGTPCTPTGPPPNWVTRHVRSASTPRPGKCSTSSRTGTGTVPPTMSRSSTATGGAWASYASRTSYGRCRRAGSRRRRGSTR